MVYVCGGGGGPGERKEGGKDGNREGEGRQNIGKRSRETTHNEKQKKKKEHISLQVGRWQIGWGVERPGEDSQPAIQEPQHF